MKTQINPETDYLLQEAYDWILLLEDPRATPQDHANFEDWRQSDPRHADIYDQAVTVRDAFSPLSHADFDPRVHRMTGREMVVDGVEKVAAVFRKTGFRIAAASAAIASVAALLFLPTINEQSHTVLEEQPVVMMTAESIVAETKTISLSDGSKVTLGPSSSIVSSYTSTARTVELVQGAAFFDVADDKDRRFSVKAGLLTATALGTSFDVRRGAGVFRVAVADGEVDVSYPFTINGQSTSMLNNRTLKAGNEVAATEESGLRSMTSIDPDQVARWREGRLTYSGAPVAELLADANRYSKIPIVVAEGSEHILDYKVRGIFRGEDVNQILGSLTAIHPIEIDQSDQTRIVLSFREND